MKTIALFCTLLGGLLFCSTQVKAEDLVFEVEGSRAYMFGELGADTADTLQQLVTDYPEVQTIVMVDVPGSNDDEEAIPAYSIVRENGLDIEIEENGEVSSGGVDFFIAGVSRSVGPGAKVGVHAWSDGTTSAADLPRSHEDHQLFIEYYRLMQLPDPEGFYFFTINAAPPDDIYYMTREELLHFGLITKQKKVTCLMSFLPLLL
jgi:hypothetical protein